MRSAASALAAALVAFAAACSHRGGAAVPPDDELWFAAGQVGRDGLELVEVREDVVAHPVAAAGRVTFDDLRVQHVTSPFAGQVRRVLVRPGDAVRKGTRLLSLLSPDVGSAFSDVVKAEADLAQASSELERQRRLVAVGAGPRRDLEAAEDAQRKASAELARAREKATLLRRGEVDLVTQEYFLRAAIDGEVLVRAVSPGMQVQGAWSGGAPAELLTVGDTDRVWVLADVPEPELPRVRVGAEATVRVAAWPGRTFRGPVDWIAGTLDPSLRTARVRVTLPNPDHALLPEMLAQVSIAAPASRALVVPRRALVAIDADRFAWVAAGNVPDSRLRFQRRRVRVAPDGGEELAVVAEGLAAGDRLAVVPAPSPPAGEGYVRITRRQAERSGMRVAEVRKEELSGALTATGRLAFDDARVARVYSPVNGRVTRVLAAPGQRVAAGAPLLALASPDVGAAFADALKARADVTAAEHELARQKDLFAAHAGARKDLESADATLRKARAELERAEAKTRLLRSGTWDAVTQELTVTSPIAGEVVARGASPGLEVQGQWSGSGSPVELFTVGALDPLWVLGEIYEMDLPSVKEGLEVAVSVPAFPDRVFRGRLEWVADVLDPVTRTVKVRCAVDNPERLLRPEMAPVLTIALPGRAQPAVPRDAVLRLGAERAVFVVAREERDELVFRRRTVVVGDDGADGRVPVLDGLLPGEKVVVSGAIFLAGLL